MMTKTLNTIEYVVHKLTDDMELGHLFWGGTFPEEKKRLLILAMLDVARVAVDEARPRLPIRFTEEIMFNIIKDAHDTSNQVHHELTEYEKTQMRTLST